MKYKLIEATYESGCGNYRREEKPRGTTHFKKYTHTYYYHQWSSKGRTVASVYTSWKKERLDGPAFVSADGKTERWYKADKLHREDGPAAYDKKGRPLYRLNGKKVSVYDVLGDTPEAMAHSLQHEGSHKPL